MSAEPTSAPGVEPFEPSIAAEVDERLNGVGRDVITLSNGVVLRLKPVPPHIIRRIGDRIPEPKVPVVFIEDKGREEENPNDPDYLKARVDRVGKLLEEILYALILLGTEIDSFPYGVSPPDADDWIADLETLGVVVDTSTPRRRYLDWVRYYAMRTELDIGLIQIGVSRLSGVTELEVMRAVRSFRR